MIFTIYSNKYKLNRKYAEQTCYTDEFNNYNKDRQGTGLS